MDKDNFHLTNIVLEKINTQKQTDENVKQTKNTKHHNVSTATSSKWGKQANTRDNIFFFNFNVIRLMTNCFFVNAMRPIPRTI